MSNSKYYGANLNIRQILDGNTNKKARLKDNRAV
jgi:hypothetical protein